MKNQKRGIREKINGITQEFVKTLFDYKDGRLYWKIKPRSDISIGTVAGKKAKCKYGFRYVVGINRDHYHSSRLIFLWHHGYLPPIVDHKDRNTLNDFIDNLRDADISQNNKNKCSKIGSTSKYLGVHFDSNRKRWIAKIKNSEKSIHLGTFKDEKMAALAYNCAAKVHHGEFANLNLVEA